MSNLTPRGHTAWRASRRRKRRRGSRRACAVATGRSVASGSTAWAPCCSASCSSSFLFGTIFFKGASSSGSRTSRSTCSTTRRSSTRAARTRREAIGNADFQAIVRAGLKQQLPASRESARTRAISRVSSAAARRLDLRDRVLNTGGLLGQHETQWLLASDDVDMLMKGHIGRGTGARPGPAERENQLGLVRPAA